MDMSTAIPMKIAELPKTVYFIKHTPDIDEDFKLFMAMKRCQTYFDHEKNLFRSVFFLTKPTRPSTILNLFDSYNQGRQPSRVVVFHPFRINNDRIVTLSQSNHDCLRTFPRFLKFKEVREASLRSVGHPRIIFKNWNNPNYEKDRASDADGGPAKKMKIEDSDDDVTVLDLDDETGAVASAYRSTPALWAGGDAAVSFDPSTPASWAGSGASVSSGRSTPSSSKESRPPPAFSRPPSPVSAPPPMPRTASGPQMATSFQPIPPPRRSFVPPLPSAHPAGGSGLPPASAAGPPPPSLRPAAAPPQRPAPATLQPPPPPRPASAAADAAAAGPTDAAMSPFFNSQYCHFNYYATMRDAKDAVIRAKDQAIAAKDAVANAKTEALAAKDALIAAKDEIIAALRAAAAPR